MREQLFKWLFKYRRLRRPLLSFIPNAEKMAAVLVPSLESQTLTDF